MRKLIVLLFAGALALAGSSALAHTDTGSGEENCDDTGCTYDNDVECSSDTPLAEAGSVGAYGAPNTAGDGGTLEACDDSGAVQGRIILQGSMSEGGRIAADGDKDNDENARGWAQVSGDSGGVTVACGDESGRLDSDHPTADDTVDDCNPS